jgi:zinc protease
LVYEKQIAQDVAAFQYSARLQGQYIITATVAEGYTTEEVVEAIDEALTELKANGVTAEDVEISKLNWEKRFYEGLQTISRKADVLNSYNTHLGDPGYVQKDLERYLEVTPDSIQTAINTHLHDKRVVLHINPPSEEATKEEASEESK